MELTLREEGSGRRLLAEGQAAVAGTDYEAALDRLGRAKARFLERGNTTMVGYVQASLLTLQQARPPSVPSVTVWLRAGENVGPGRTHEDVWRPRAARVYH